MRRVRRAMSDVNVVDGSIRDLSSNLWGIRQRLLNLSLSPYCALRAI